MLKKLLIALSLTFLLTIPTLAREFLNESTCVVEAERTVVGTVFSLCETLTINGTVQGDVIALALRTVINGTVNGNLYIASGQLDINGVISSDIHFVGAVLRIQSPRPLTILGGVKGIALSFLVGELVRVEKGMIVAGYQLIIDGHVSGEINFWGSTFQINGTVTGNIYATVGNPASRSSQLETLLLPLQFDIDLVNPGLEIYAGSTINGDVFYTGPVEGIITGAVNGITVFDPLPQVTLPTLEEPGSIRIFVSQVGREFTTLLAIGVFTLLVIPRFMNIPMRHLRIRPFASFSVGLLAFILSFPIVLIAVSLSLAVLILLQIIGFTGLVLAVAILLAMLNVGIASIFYFVAIFVARALVGIAVGRIFMRLFFPRFFDDSRRSQLIALVIGMILLSLIISLPVVGWFFNAASLFLGLGAFLSVFLDQLRRVRDSTPATAVYTPSPAITMPRPPLKSVPQMPIPPADNPAPPIQIMQPRGIGTENLPDGFDLGFFEES